MKKTMLKRVFAAFMATALIVGVSACKKEEDKTNAGTNSGANAGTSQTTGQGTTEDPVSTDVQAEADYEEHAQNAFAGIADLEAKIKEAATKDEAEAKKIYEEIKEPFEKFLTVTAPEKFEEAHEKLKEGCEKAVATIEGAATAAEEDVKTDIAEITGHISEGLQKIKEKK